MTTLPAAVASNEPSAAPAARDRMLDGFRAVAVSGVMFGHAITYRYLGPVTGNDKIDSLIYRAGGPFAEAGVYLFFAISGYIITALMMREEGREEGVNLAAFYVRRSLRILPPLLLFLATIVVLGKNGAIDFEPAQALGAIAFTCNTGFTACGWFVAHTWSLSVEEQYYLVWPLLFSLLAVPLRGRFAATATLVLIAIFVVTPFVYQSNAISFACIAAGATCALQARWREALERAGGPVSWILAAAFLGFGPVLIGEAWVGPFVPLLTVFLLFSGRRIAVLRVILESAPFQFVGRMSYSLYLWQQLFLAASKHFAKMQPPPIWLLPVVAYLSLRVIERPCMALAHRLSKAIIARKVALVPTWQLGRLAVFIQFFLKPDEEV